MKTIISTLGLGIILILSSCASSNVQEPEYRDIRNVRLVDIGVLQSTAGIDLIYYNPNNFGVTLSEARGDVYVDNEYLGRFSLEEKVQVGKRSEFIVPALIKLDMIGALKNHRDLYKKKDALVRIDGVARVKKSGFSKDVPIKYESMQNLDKFRSLVAR